MWKPQKFRVLEAQSFGFETAHFVVRGKLKDLNVCALCYGFQVSYFCLLHIRQLSLACFADFDAKIGGFETIETIFNHM